MRTRADTQVRPYGSLFGRTWLIMMSNGRKIFRPYMALPNRRTPSSITASVFDAKLSRMNPSP